MNAEHRTLIFALRSLLVALLNKEQTSKSKEPWHSTLDAGRWLFDVRCCRNHPLKSQRNQFLVVILAISSLLVLVPVVSLAADDTDLEEILEGFDDDAGSQADEALDDVLEGFEDDASPADAAPPKAAAETAATPTEAYPTFTIGGSARFRAF